MATVSTPVPRSSGKNLEVGKDSFGFLTDSSPYLDDREELLCRFEEDGYLYLKQFFPREKVLAVRKGLLERMRDLNLLLPDSDPLEAVANPDRSTSFLPELAKDNLALEELIYGSQAVKFYEKLLGGPIRHYDFTWFRPVGPGRGTSPHCDLVYMGRGTRQVFTMWVPYGYVPVELGGLMVLEKSHRKNDLLRNYLSRDVDSFCVNRPGADLAGQSNSLLWDGKLAKDPVSLRKKLGQRWLTAEFEPGDMVTFGMTLVHGSLDNQTDRIRLSSDSRYQLASEPVDERWIGTNPLGHSSAGKRGRVC